jgi:hypothetical protein
MNPNEILNKILAHYKISYNKLATELGLKRTQNLYDIRDGKTGISKKLANQITKWEPEINILWLLTGEGEMLKNNQTSENTNSPGIVGNNVFGGGINDATIISGLMRTIEKRDEQIDRLLSIIEKLRN